MQVQYEVNIDDQPINEVVVSAEDQVGAADRARLQHNADLAVPNNPDDPDFCADVPAYVQWVMSHAFASYFVQYPPA